MALPMVHLLAAYAWAQDKPELFDNPDYYLGVISPDAIHMRDGNDKSHKDAIHLHNWIHIHPEWVIRYWLDHASAFDIGYGVHVLTDCQWVRRFHDEFKALIRPDGRPDPEIYYNDNRRIDYELYQKNPLREQLFALVARAQAPADHPLLRREEIEGWRENTFEYYEKPYTSNVPLKYFTPEYVERFLNDCGQLLDETYGRFKDMNETQSMILARRSTRGFTDAALTKEETNALVDAALASPSACNYQDWHFCFIRNRAKLDAFAREYRTDFLPQGKSATEDAAYHIFFHAPLCVFITLPESPSSRFAQVDAGIAVENLAISAQALGLGSVIVGRPMDVFNSKNGATWEREFGFLPGHHFAIGICIGHANTSKQAHPIGEGKFSFID